MDEFHPTSSSPPSDQTRRKLHRYERLLVDDSHCLRWIGLSQQRRTLH